MKTVSISVERNFHCMNDDRFIMEKISMTVELNREEDEGKENFAIDEARKIIESNFKAAYPKVEESLNFNIVRQVNKDNDFVTNKFRNIQPNGEQETWKHPNPNALISKSEQKITKPTNEPLRKWEIQNPTDTEQAIEKINKGTIEEQIDPSFNLIKEIKKCETMKELNSNRFLIKTEEERKAFNDKELFIKAFLNQKTV